VEESDLVSSTVEVFAPALPIGLEAPLRLPLFCLLRVVNELLRGRFRDNLESLRLTFGRVDSGSFRG